MGLLAFAVTTIAGLWVGVPSMVILSRAVWALLLFCVIGLVLGAVAQMVINEHYRRREKEVLGDLQEREAAEEDSEILLEAEPSPEQAEAVVG